MTRLRLLPIVLFAASALLCLKLAGLVAGVGSFAVGPVTAAAQSGEAPAPRETPDFLGPPLDLAAEAEALERQRAAEAAALAEESPPEGTATPPAGTAAPDPEATAGADPVPAAGAPSPEAIDVAEAAAPDPAAGGLRTDRPEEYQPRATGSEGQFLESLANRRADLDRREADLALRARLLEAAEAQLQARIDELKALEAQLNGGADGEGGAPPGGGEDLRNLVTMYEQMKPKAAARVFNDLDLGVLIAVAETMNPRRMSAILAVMEPGRAAVLTTALAGDQSPRQVIVRREDPVAAMPPPPARELPKIMPAPGGG